ncbi:T9SS type B sorting domain-containing protein [Winogradskyella bathintestinalis]|uniref:Choice-of-anchor L domain-containing protein n=1 Tax=Winogradskyella bathintestinalis TaxID=3035208 RepID=A0ABT7ZWQ7_9FLAO|nr:choice-of-anchor L domain-containing protein [Winogradskyella bathintestinalis]MDN3493443.1 choice-of-anchor L domain-containing protein [Winogradskyella bathintestinalis]
MINFNRSLYLFIGLICSISFAQQVTIDNSVSTQDLIQNTLIQGCVEVSNISSPSNGTSIGIGSFGYFERASSNFPFADGIVLTTGNANSAGNGQNNDILNEGDATWLTDSDLETALGISGTVNATSIEFEFISISNQIQFNYILASEEYFGNFPCEYSDGFAFLIKEAGSSDPYTNIALIPGTTIPVNTNTVHDDIVGFCPASNDEFFEGYNVGDTNYNGRTTVLSATATIQPNVQYQIKLVIADQTDQNYDSAVFIEGNSFDASVDLGDDFSTCATSTVLDGNISNTNATYTWYFNDTLMSSENQASLTALQTGNYRVEISLPLAGSSCIIEDDINVTLSSTQTSDPLTDFQLCDDLSGDGLEIFDLSTKDSEVLASVPPSSYTISYHYTNTDAIDNSNAITTPIQNTGNPQLIHVRIEDTINGCLAFSSFNLIVNNLPIITDPTPLEVCDDQTADGITAMDLNFYKDQEIALGQTNLVVTYHSSASDAAAGVNAYTMPYTNTNVNEQLFVSVQNPDTGCISTTTLDVSVIDSPIINMEDHYIDACDTDLDGFANFDLTSIIPEVLEGLSGVNVSFHISPEDALSGANPIADETNYANITNQEQLVYLRAENGTSGCASTVPIELHTNLLLTATNIRNVSVCDVDDDNTESFDFENIAVGIINDLLDVEVVFYETEEDRDNQVNPINTDIAYQSQSNPQTIYIGLQSLTCYEVSDFDLVLFPIVQFESVISLSVCDTDQDGFTTTDLSSLNLDVTNGEDGYNVTYFLTEQDAIDNTNALPNSYTNLTNPFTLFPRITSSQTGCYDYNSFEVTVLPAPESEKPTDIIICDADRDGFSTINLNNSVPHSILATPNRSVTFHTSLQEAQLNENAIETLSNYNAQTQIVYMRVENTITGCYSIEELDIIVNTFPFVGDLSNYVNELNFCEDNSDGIGEFIFVNKDLEALSGQTGKEVSYYLNATDAIAKVNPIDKTSIYENISNPQQIHVRVDNITDETCFTTSSFRIEVGTNPVYNEPTDLFVCDDSIVDGSVMHDFTTKIEEVSNGISDIQSVKFFTSEEDAINSTNEIPLQFANTVNPQQIFVQIDNGTICQSITSFVVNIISTPAVAAVDPMVECDDNADGYLQFDLTGAENHILDVRQEDLVFAYYENFDDAEANVNQITNPDRYTNLTNPQTVYFKVTNIISNCYLSLPIELIVNQPPHINDFEQYTVCANETNSIDLTEINPTVTDVNYNVIFSYFDNEADAVANTNALDTNYIYQSDFDTLFVRTEYSTTHCSTYYQFNLKVEPLPIAHQAADLINCDDNFDGILEFDLSQQNATVLGSQNANLFTVTYHNSELEAQENNSRLETNYMAYDGEIIYTRIETNSTGCYSTGQFSVIVNPLPLVNIENQVICLDNMPLLVSANTNNITDFYEWSTGETTPEIDITEVGSYWVKVTSEFGCETTNYFEVSESEAATIETTEVIDFSDPNNITVTISGIGNYLYQLDDMEPQESNVFENVAMGYHIVTIIDLNGCANETKEVLVVDIPKFFTPNNDGTNDTWHIVGIETLPGTIIHVFDRYGKLLTKLSAQSSGWNGKYNGERMPTSDYWYVADVQRGSIAFQVKGHFTLKR